MKEVIGAGTWHQQLLERGLELEFTSDPVAYREENNKSAVSHLDLVREKLKVWLESDSIEELEKPAWCTIAWSDLVFFFDFRYARFTRSRYNIFEPKTPKK